MNYISKSYQSSYFPTHFAQNHTPVNVNPSPLTPGIRWGLDFWGFLILLTDPAMQGLPLCKENMGRSDKDGFERKKS